MNDCSYHMTFKIRAAIANRDLRTVKRLAATCPAILHHDTPHQWPVIHECISGNCVDLELMELFISSGGDVNRKTESGVSLAYLAAVHCEGSEVERALRNSGASLTDYEAAVVTITTNSEDDGKMLIPKIRKLLDRTTDLRDQVGDRGFSLLHHAINSLMFDLVPLLLDYKFDPNKKTFLGQTPLGMCSSVSAPDGQVCRDLLLRFGATQTDQEQLAALIVARKNAEAIKALKKSPLLMHSYIPRSGYPLHIAAQFDRDSTLVEYLLSHRV